MVMDRKYRFERLTADQPPTCEIDRFDESDDLAPHGCYEDATWEVTTDLRRDDGILVPELVGAICADHKLALEKAGLG